MNIRNNLQEKKLGENKMACEAIWSSHRDLEAANVQKTVTGLSWQS